MATDFGTEWPSFALTEVFDVRSGLSKPASDFGSGFPFVTFKDVLDNYFLPDTLGSLVRSTVSEREGCSVRRGDVFLTRTSETLEDLGMSSVALRDYEGATFNGFTKRLRPKYPTRIVPEYAAYFFRSPGFRAAMSAYASLSTRASLNNDMLDRLQIKLPDVKTQEAIGYTLRALDDKIGSNRRTIRALKRLAEAIFHAWFLDFDPVKVKAGGAASFPSMPQSVFNDLPTDFTDSEIGQIPTDWAAGTLGSILKESTEKNRDEQVNLVLSAVNTGELIASDDHFTKRVYSKSLKNYKIVPPGAVAFNPSRINIGSIGVNHRGVPGVVSPVYVVCAAHPEFEWFLEFYLHLPKVRQQYETLASGSVRQSLRVVDFLSIELAIPTNRILLAFNGVFLTLHRLVNAMASESAKLAAARDYLLPKLLGGQARVEIGHG